MPKPTMADLTNLIDQIIHKSKLIRTEKREKRESVLYARHVT